MGGGGQAAHLLLVGIAVQKPHARHAGGADAHRPGRAARDLQRQARRQARRLHQPAARLPLAPGGGGHVHRQDQRVKPRIPRAGQHVGADARIARRIHLEPALIALRAAEVLGRSRRHRGQAIGNARRRAVAGQQAFRIGPDQPRHPHRRDAEGHRVVAAEEGRAEVRRDLAAQRGGPEQDPVERGAVARQDAFAAGRAVEEFPHEMRECAASRGP
jgi:hypothetical protein